MKSVLLGEKSKKNLTIAVQMLSGMNGCMMEKLLSVQSPNQSTLTQRCLNMKN